MSSIYSIASGFVFKWNIDIKRIIIPFLLMAILFSFFRATYNYYQTIYEYYKIPVEFFGVFPVLFNVLASIGSQIYGRALGKISSEKRQIAFMGLVLLLSTAAIYFINGLGSIVIGMIFVQQIIRGILMS